MVVFAYIYSLQVKTRWRRPLLPTTNRFFTPTLEELFKGDADSILDTRSLMDATPAFNLSTWKWEK